uniref:Uncharacterized protein n=1 Tax=Ascaris lumbricoides TaxID=6252 RepID=A0A0M3IC28_ASCLU
MNMPSTAQTDLATVNLPYDGYLGIAYAYLTAFCRRNILLILPHIYSSLSLFSFNNNKEILHCFQKHFHNWL